MVEQFLFPDLPFFRSHFSFSLTSLVFHKIKQPPVRIGNIRMGYKLHLPGKQWKK